jgi:hypothetical protein
MGPPRKGALRHTWGPFRVRTYTQIALRKWYAVSIMLGPDNEIRFARLQRSEDTLLGLAQVLRRSLRALAWDIKSLDEHLSDLQQPERLAALQAQLDEEAQERQDDTEQLNAAQVLANQHDLRRDQQHLYESIEAGLHDLEDEFPELGADSS